MPPSEAQQIDLRFITRADGRPFASPGSFGKKFAEWCIEAGFDKSILGDDGKLRNYRAHGLRKRACIELAENDCTAPQIQAVSGHSSLDQV